MTRNATLDSKKLGPFSHDEVKALMMTIGVGLVLGFAVDLIDDALPNDHKMKAILQRIVEGRNKREVPKQASKTSYDMKRPHVGFDVTE